ncbi:MAG: aminotransferase class IV [Flavobacteriales bacterium]|nr:aminotransferase class IV [Flavobacteriales bacterium]
MSYVNNNGAIIPADTYSIKAGNRAHLYGDGLFESIRVINGTVVNLDNHIKRLLGGMEALKMNIPSNFTSQLFETEISALLEKNEIDRGGFVRLSVDRRAGGKFLPLTNDVDYFIEARALPNNRYVLNEEGYKIDQYEDIKKSINQLSAFKTKNSLIYILAKLKAQEKGLDDLLIQNDKMGIIEGGSSNLFVISNGVLYTPGLDLGCLGGTMRMQIINLALENDIKVYECNIAPQNLLVADEVFLTNAISGIVWVGSYRTKQYSNDLSKKMVVHLNEKWNAE